MHFFFATGFQEFKINMKQKWFFKNIPKAFKGPCKWNNKKVHELRKYGHTWCKKFNKKYYDISGPEAARKWISTQVTVVATSTCASLGISPDLIDPNAIKLKIQGQL